MPRVLGGRQGRDRQHGSPGLGTWAIRLWSNARLRILPSRAGRAALRHPVRHPVGTGRWLGCSHAARLVRRSGAHGLETLRRRSTRAGGAFPSRATRSRRRMRRHTCSLACRPCVDTHRDRVDSRFPAFAGHEPRRASQGRRSGTSVRGGTHGLSAGVGLDGRLLRAGNPAGRLELDVDDLVDAEVVRELFVDVDQAARALELVEDDGA